MTGGPRTPRSTPTALPAALRWLILAPVVMIAIACGGAPGAPDAREGTRAEPASERAAAPAAEPSEAELSEDATWFEVSGSRAVEARPAKASIVRMADLPLFEDDHPGLLLKVRQDGPKPSKASRIEIFPLPNPAVPGEYPLVEGSSTPDGTIGASVILPKDREKVFLPMAIYGEGVSGTLTLLESPPGTLRGRFTLDARLDANAEGPAVRVTGAFERVVIPKAE